MEPLTHYAIAIIYQHKTPPPPAYQGEARRSTGRWLRLPRRLPALIRQSVAGAPADRQPHIAPTLTECCREQE